MPDLFISYSHSDIQKIEPILNELARLKIDAYIDRELELGKPYNIILTEKQDQSAATLVFWSADSVKKEWVIAEASRAHKLKKLVPISIEPEVIKDNLLSIIFSGLHTSEINMNSDWVKSDSWTNIISQIGSILHRDLIGWIKASNTNSASAFIGWAELNKSDALYEFAVREAQSRLQSEIAKLISKKSPFKRDDNIELEIKLGAENIQAKYIIAGDQESLVDAVKYVLTEMNFLVNKVSSKLYRDAYFDDRGILQSNGYFLRVREQEGKDQINVTIKSLHEINEKSGGDALIRAEYSSNFTPIEFNDLLMDPSALVRIVSKEKLELIYLN